MPHSNRPRTFTQIARDYGVARKRVREVVDEHGIPTYRVGMARVVGPEDWPRLRDLLRPHVPRRRPSAAVE